MKNPLLLLLCFFITGLSCQAQSKDEQAVAHAVATLNQAMVDGNQIQLFDLTSASLSYGHSNGLIEDKDAFITALIDGVSGFSAIELTDQTIAISNSMAIVRHNASCDTDNKGQAPGHSNLGVLQVWRKEKGKWLLFARHATKFP